MQSVTRDRWSARPIASRWCSARIPNPGGLWSGPDDPALDAISPIRHLGAITVPVLLIHGKDDTVVPFEQSQAMYDALQKDKKDVELVTLKQEDHWLSRSVSRLQMLQTSAAFLRSHNPPDP